VGTFLRHSVDTVTFSSKFKIIYMKFIRLVRQTIKQQWTCRQTERQKKTAMFCWVLLWSPT